jgi:hypothetical protein
MQEQKPATSDCAPSAILVSMRRRIARLGALVTFLAAALAAVAVFAVCACKSMH